MLKRLFIALLFVVFASPVSAGTGQGKGSCIYCHPGGVPAGQGLTCGGCHVNPPPTGAHATHTDGAGALYGSDANGSATAYSFNCGNCHPGDITKHGDNRVEVELYNAAATGMKKYNPSSAGSTGTGSATVCSNIYCHSAGQPGSSNTYAATPSWGGSFSGNRCAGCHGYPPAYPNNAPKANSHDAHAFSCDTCHSGTTDGSLKITNPGLHVNGTINVTAGAGATFSYTYAATGGTCNNISCHANTSATWGGTAACDACHGSPPPLAAAGYTAVDESTSPHQKHAGKGANYSFTCSQCHKGNKHGNGTFQDVFLDTNGVLAGQNATYSSQTCSNVYCHSNGSPADSGIQYKAVSWGNVHLPSDCTGCHGGNALSAAPIASGKHGGHISLAGGNYRCATCHSATVGMGSDRTITGMASHVDGTKTVQFAGSGVYFSSTRTCGSTDCHQAGKPTAPQPPAPTWGGANLGCNGCHGTGNPLGAPDYPNAGPAAPLANSHAKHARSTSDCDSCHVGTTTSGTSIVVGSVLHTNRALDVTFDSARAGGSAAFNTNTKTCSNVMCHNGTSVIWGGSLPADCTGCHGNDSASSSPIVTGKHGAHIANEAVLGTGNNFGCVECHAKTVDSDRNTISAAHANGMKDYSGARAGQIATAGTGKCNNNYCHSSGQRPEAVAFVNMTGASWYSGRSLDCTGCHGNAAVAEFAPLAGAPNYANGGAGTPIANSHNKHVAGAGVADSTGCASCHAATVDAGVAGKLRNYSSSHINGTRDVAFTTKASMAGVQGRYSSSSQQCLNTYCHGAAATPQWGSAGLSCNACHAADAASFGARGAGAHAAHYQVTAPPASGSYATMPAGEGSLATASSYQFNCTSCHAAPAQHAGGEAMPGAAAAQVNFGFSAQGMTGSYSYGTTAGSDNGYKWTAGSCSTTYCHSDGNGGSPANTSFTWGSPAGTLGCTGCHGGNVASGKAIASGKHGAHINNASFLGSNFGCAECHAKTVDSDTHLKNKLKHVNGFKDYSGTRAGASYDVDSGSCSSYCHSDGKGTKKNVSWKTSGALDCRGCHGSDANAAFTSSAAGEPNYPNAGEGTPRANSHKNHTAAGVSTCDACHTGTTTTGTAINAGSALHANGTANVTFNPAKAGATVTYDPATKTCANISCHGNKPATWGGTATCLVCHSVVQGSRAAITPQFGANSHHIQGAVSDDKCFQCHWEANADGTINPLYHGGGSAPGAPVDLVVYGAGSRPASYSTTNTVTAVQYTANGSRSEVGKINTHCIGCHSDQNNSTTPFGDGKTPRQYAWDGTSVAARYGQTGVTSWGKYDSGTYTNANQKDKLVKAFSAHGNASANKRGWNSSTGVDGAITDAGTANAVQCYDCHNSHGSTVNGSTTRYVSATTNGGILKDTAAGVGGYAVAYKPYSAGSSLTKNKRNPGASLCLDCHLNATASSTPWGYTATFGATQSILGYWDSAYFGPGTFGSQTRYSYKAGTSHMGGHFGASDSLSAPAGQGIGGLCTPCHDPHGVSPTLGANMQYAVPLLKGTWLTSPYREDAAPMDDAAGTALWSTPYHIDQNTFGGSAMQENASQFGGLCLGCHSQTSLTNGTDHTWRSKDRIHEAVKGWKTANGTIKHQFACSKCHSPHNSRLPRLMVTNCLNTMHKGNKVYNPAPVLSGSGSGDWSSCYSDVGACNDWGRWDIGSGGGSGSFPGNYSGTAVGTNAISCHEGNSSDERWNDVTPWGESTPTITSGPGASIGGPRVLMHMDEAAWNGTANEVRDSGYEGDNGTAYGGATTAAGGLTGSAGSFNGTSAYVLFNYGATAPADNFTIEAWVKPTTTDQIETEATAGTPGTSGQRYLFFPDNMGDVNSGAGISMGINGISVFEHGGGYMPPLAVYSGTVSSSLWNHVAVVYNNKRPSIYLNGVLVRTGLKSTRGHVYAPRMIGGGAYGYFPGLVDEVSIYDKALSGTDIQLHSQQQCSSISTTSLVSGTIRWTTKSSYTTSFVEYGPTASYGSTAGDDTPVLNHSVTLTGLTNHTTYHYRVRSKTVGGAEVVSADATFTVDACVVADPPGLPSSITTAAGNGSASISWIPGADATSSLLRYGTVSGSYTSTIDPATSPYALTGLTPWQPIYFQVGAKNANGTVWSDEYTVTPGGNPGAPTNISATPGTAQSTIYWTAGTNSTSSLIHYGTASGVYGTIVDPAWSGTTIPITSGQVIYYQVGARNSFGTTWSAEYTTTAASLPAAPTAVTVTPGYGQATFSWTAGAGAASSMIHYNTVNNGSYPYTVDPAVSPRTITSLANGTTYYFQVGSKNPWGSAWSSQYSVTPSVSAPTAPTGIGAVVGNGQLTVSWSAVGSATSYNIRYGTASGVYTGSITGAISASTITGLANGTAIYYQVASVNASGTTWSSEYAATPSASAPAAVTGISGTPGNGQATFAWTGSTGAASYSIRYGTASGNYPTTLGSVTSPRTVPSLANGTAIYYRIGAVSGSYTTWSAEYTVTPSASAPLAATGVTVTPGYGQGTVTWSAGTNATSSAIRYGTVSGVYGGSIATALSPQTITGLTNGVTVYYQLGSVNASGTTWSTDYTFIPSASAPQAPTAIASTPGNGQGTITWTAGTSSTSSNIRYGSASGNYPNLITAASSPRTITPLTNGSILYYEVGAVNGSGTTWSGEYTVLPTPSAPSAASGISLVAGNTQATVIWTAGSGSTSSALRYGTVSGVYPSSVPSATSPQAVTGLTNGATYYFQVGAVNASGTTWSTESSVVPSGTAMPVAPTAISSTPGNGQATISWTAGVNSTSSLVRYGTATGTYTTTVDPAVSPWTRTGLSNGTTYYYQVGAKNGTNIAWSGEYTVTPVGPPGVPSNISMVAGDTQITVSWTPGTGATSSLLRYQPYYSGTLVTIDPATSPYVLTGLANNGWYTVQVGAKNSAGITWAATAYVMPIPPPAAPTSVSATAGNGQLTLAWGVGGDASSSTLRYGTVSGNYTTTIATVATPYTMTGVNGQTVYYQVGAVNSAGTTWSPEYSVTPTSAAPASATGISAVGAYGQFTATWTPGSGGTSSVIRYGLTSNSLTSTTGTVLSPATVTGLPVNYTIFYQIGTVNGSGTTWSTQYSVYTTNVAPQQPTVIFATPGDAQASISWTAGVSSTGSVLKYGTATGAYATTIDPVTSPTTLTGPNGTAIYYRVGAKNSTAVTWSEEYSVVPGAPVAPTPVTTDYTYAAGYYYYRYYNTDCVNQTPLAISWNPVTASDGDPVEYNVILNGVAQGWQSGTTFGFNGDPGASYQWTVRARDAVHTNLVSTDQALPMEEFSYSCSSSCPLVYSYNGSDYSYQSDLQGPAISQIKKGQRYVNLYQPSYLVLGDLKPDTDNSYRVKVWESLQEATLLDEAKLLTVDYPQGYQIVSSSAENTYYYAYANPFSITTIKDPVLPVGAIDKYGKDVLASVVAVDDTPAPMDPNDVDNYYTFDFGPVQHPEYAKLVIDGWQDINSKIFTSTAFVQPYIEVLDPDGKWVKVKSFGMPAGDLKTMVVDLANVFQNADQRVRLHLGIKKAQVWLLDRIRLDTSAPVQVTVQEAAASSAQLGMAGQAIASMPSLKHRMITTPLANAVDPDNFGYGNFTRYGDVMDLLTQRDDKYVVMNYADALELKFPAGGAPAQGMTRGFILKADLYYKEFKEYKYLDPMPFHAMSDYPYVAPEAYPTDADHQTYLATYNTRVFTPPVAPTPTAPTGTVPGTAGGAQVSFAWSAVTAPDGDSVQYQVEVSPTQDFASVSYRSPWTADTGWNQPLPAGTWYWRVTDRDAVHPTVQLTSTVASFSITGM